MVYSANNSINESVDYLKGCNPVYVAPANTPLDEMVYYMIESSEEDFNDIMMSVGVSELAHLEESHTEMIYEGVDLKGYVDKIVKWFEEQWKKVQGLINKALEEFNKRADAMREKVFKKVDDAWLKKRVAGLGKNKKFGDTFEFSGIEGNFNKTSAFDGKDKEIETAYEAAVARATDADKSAINNLGDKLDDIVKSAINSAVPGHNVSLQSISSITKFMVQDLRGKAVSRNGDWVKNNWTNIVDEVIKFPSTKREIKKNYDTTKKSFNEAIKQAKKLASAKNQSFEAAAYSKAVGALKKLRQASMCACSALISVLRQRYSFYCTVVMRVAVSKAVKESYSSTSDRLNSLFEW